MQETLEFYFEKKVNDLLASFVPRDEFNKAMVLKLDNRIFRDYEKSVEADRT